MYLFGKTKSHLLEQRMPDSISKDSANMFSETFFIQVLPCLCFYKCLFLCFVRCRPFSSITYVILIVNSLRHIFFSPQIIIEDDS